MFKAFDNRAPKKYLGRCFIDGMVLVLRFHTFLSKLSYTLCQVDAADFPHEAHSEKVTTCIWLRMTEEVCNRTGLIVSENSIMLFPSITLSWAIEQEMVLVLHVQVNGIFDTTCPPCWYPPIVHLSSCLDMQTITAASTSKPAAAK